MFQCCTALRDAGKIRFLGLTERFVKDTTHAMLTALLDDCWDAVMVGFNLLNPSARRRILTRTSALDIGVMNMFAVRRALSGPTWRPNWCIASPPKGTWTHRH